MCPVETKKNTAQMIIIIIYLSNTKVLFEMHCE